MNYIASVFAGLFLCNCIPHLVAGLMGYPFPSPFAKPPGRGDSYPLVNFLWGFFNLVVGVALWSWSYTTLGLDLEMLFSGIGFLLMGLMLSIHFGKVYQEKLKHPKNG